ncbi:MAG: acyl-CoA dehydratase activase [Candidatus Binataceae bacterium]
MSTVAAIGIDAGSTTTKLAGVSADGTLIGWRLQSAHPCVEEQVAQMLDELRAEVGATADVPTVATGYGRKLLTATKSVTEITCHARGVHGCLGTTGTLVDIGGQDTKVIRIGAGGKPVDFRMNDKCAAGTGRFLENTAARLALPLDEFARRALAGAAEVPISSTCTVFAESEIISLIARGIALDAIVRGLHRSMISRVVTMIYSVGLVAPLMLSGGVARNPAVRAMLQEATGQPVVVPEHPQLMGAYGAALLVLEATRESRAPRACPAARGAGAEETHR